MREIRPSGSEGGGTETNRSFLPLSEPRAGRAPAGQKSPGMTPHLGAVQE